MAPSSALMDEIVEEILLRVPPDDPARHVHAALVCKAWCRLVADPRFRRRYREHHGSAPMLGFFYGYFRFPYKFVSTSSFRPPNADDDLCGWGVADSRYGRVLLHNSDHTFMVWDPSHLDQRTRLPRPPVRFGMAWNAAVLCAANTACDHLDCHQGPFLVVFLAKVTSYEVLISVYSSEDGSWSDPTINSGLHDDFNRNGHGRRACVLMGNVLHFSLDYTKDIVQYNLGTRQVSFIQLLPSRARFALMNGEDGRLELATVEDNFRLCIWSRQDVCHGDAGGWVKSRVIEPKELLNPFSSAHSDLTTVAGAADGIGVIFLRTVDGIFTIDLKSGRATNVSEDNIASNIHPYMSFYPPVRGLAALGSKGPSTSASGA